MRRRFALCVYGYVIMPEHVHVLLSEPQRALLSDAVHYLKLSFAKRLVAQVRPVAQVSQVAQVRAPLLGANLGVPSGVFWQKRYYDRNVRDEREFVEKLRYIHRNPVKPSFPFADGGSPTQREGAPRPAFPRPIWVSK